MSPGVLWASIKDLLFREATLATPGSLAFKRAAQIRQVSHAMPQSSVYFTHWPGWIRCKQRMSTVQFACQGKYKHFYLVFSRNVP